MEPLMRVYSSVECVLFLACLAKIYLAFFFLLINIIIMFFYIYHILWQMFLPNYVTNIFQNLILLKASSS